MRQRPCVVGTCVIVLALWSGAAAQSTSSPAQQAQRAEQERRAEQDRRAEQERRRQEQERREERERQAEERQRQQAAAERERQAEERQRQQQAAAERERQAEERQRQQQAAAERERQAERQREQQATAERQREQQATAERQRQQQVAAEQQRQAAQRAEQERQRLVAEQQRLIGAQRATQEAPRSLTTTPAAAAASPVPVISAATAAGPQTRSSGSISIPAAPRSPTTMAQCSAFENELTPIRERIDHEHEACLEGMRQRKIPMQRTGAAAEADCSFDVCQPYHHPFEIGQKQVDACRSAVDDFQKKARAAEEDARKREADRQRLAREADAAAEQRRAENEKRLQDAQNRASQQAAERAAQQSQRAAAEKDRLDRMQQQLEQARRSAEAIAERRQQALTDITRRTDEAMANAADQPKRLTELVQGLVRSDNPAGAVAVEPIVRPDPAPAADPTPAADPAPAARVAPADPGGAALQAVLNKEQLFDRIGAPAPEPTGGSAQGAADPNVDAFKKELAAIEQKFQLPGARDATPSSAAGDRPLVPPGAGALPSATAIPTPRTPTPAGQLRQFTESEVVLSPEAAAQVIRFFWPSSTDAPASLTTEDRAFAQGLLLEAIDASHEMSYIDKAFDTAMSLTTKPPETLTGVAREFLKSASGEWFRHKTRADLADPKIYELVRAQIASNFGRDWKYRHLLNP